VFASEDITAGQFVVQYAGELVSAAEGVERENISPSVFRYFFQWKGNKYW